MEGPHGSFRIVEADDAEAAHAQFTRLFPAARLAPLGRGPVWLRHAAVRLGDLALAVLSARNLVSVTQEPRNLLLALRQRTGPGAAIVTQAGAELTVDDRHGILLGLRPTRVPFLLPEPHLALRLEPGAIERQLTALLGRRVALPEFQPQLDLALPGPGSIARTLRHLADELERSPQLAANPVIAAGWQDLLLNSVLGGLPHSASELLRARFAGAAPWQVRRAEAWLEANAALPVSMHELAAAVGVPLRTLQLAFQRSRGYSPSAFLRRCRLDLARRRLLEPRPGETVTTVAMDCGFAHLGDFARRYRERFGEGPGETLRRAR